MRKIEARHLNCPSCGAPITVETAYAKTVVCPYCDSTNLIEDKGLSPAGKMAKISRAPSIFSVGRSGAIEGKRFRILGRLRYDYEDGFWDEWYLKYEDGKAGWISEEEGECTLFFKEAVTGEIDLGSIRVGQKVMVNGRQVFITEIQDATLAGGEGELNYRAVPGTAVTHYEGNASGTLISIEVWPRELEVHAGHPVSYESIHMDETEGEP
ncbi:MAG: DUF4178 domain-containing protein [Candidatus Eremiobacteraeota bacterium]|nr:DUF4178 domain-containing protein [Candidatus Eremiobacteraeota bacterium]